MPVPSPLSCRSIWLVIVVLSFPAVAGAQKREDSLERSVDQQLSYLALGDSYTIGESVKVKKRWPMQLVKKMAAEKVHVAEPSIVAETGWTTDELAEAIQAAVEKEQLASDYDLVTLLIGVNNQYRGRSVDEYGQEFEELLQTAIRFAGNRSGRVVVVSIPDYGLTPFISQKPDRDAKQIAAELDAFNASAKEITEKYRARWVDITGVSRQHGKKPKMLAEDELHPSGKMYAQWVKEILPVAIEALQEAK